MPKPDLQPWMRRLLADLALWAAIGAVMALLGPFGTAEEPLALRLPYWQVCMVGGGLIGIAIDEPLRRRVRHFWVRVLSASVLMTPPVTLLVAVTNALTFGAPLGAHLLGVLWFEVLIVCFASMTFRQLAWAQSTQAAPATAPAGETEDPTAAFRRRLSAKRRDATLIAVEAEDHYLRVHTDAGEELVTARFGDALAELAGARGFRTHRCGGSRRRRSTR